MRVSGISQVHDTEGVAGERLFCSSGGSRGTHVLSFACFMDSMNLRPASVVDSVVSIAVLPLPYCTRVQRVSHSVEMHFVRLVGARSECSAARRCRCPRRWRGEVGYGAVACRTKRRDNRCWSILQAPTSTALATSTPCTKPTRRSARKPTGSLCLLDGRPSAPGDDAGGALRLGSRSILFVNVVAYRFGTV